ncbi:unnamed protein product [Urochloa humidicola]
MESLRYVVVEEELLEAVVDDEEEPLAAEPAEVVEDDEEEEPLAAEPAEVVEDDDDEEEELLAADEPEVVKPAMLITVVVQDTKRRALSRTMRRTDKLQDLMDYYYDVLSPAVEYGEGRFLFDGARVKGQQTPEDLDMVSGDKIDFFPDLTGGSYDAAPGPGSTPSTSG